MFPNEKVAVAQLTDLILRAGASLFKATKYIYALSAESFYNCDIKDFFKVILNNIGNVDGLGAFHIPVNDNTCGALNTPEYDKVFRLIVFSFAIRLPILCNVKVEGNTMSEQQIRAIYSAILGKGISNIDNAISESFSDIQVIVRKRRDLSPYNADWLRAYLFNNFPELSDISNRNLFFIGAIDVLFVLFYICLEKEVAGLISSLSISQEPRN